MERTLIDAAPNIRQSDPMLKISDITYSVAGRTLVENASVTIPTGHKVGLVGRNGSGKTTLWCQLCYGKRPLDTATSMKPCAGTPNALGDKAADWPVVDVPG